jgi:hypothetical protein
MYAVGIGVRVWKHGDGLSYLCQGVEDSGMSGADDFVLTVIPTNAIAHSEHAH